MRLVWNKSVGIGRADRHDLVPPGGVGGDRLRIGDGRRAGQAATECR